MKTLASKFFKDVQNSICTQLETLEPAARFISDSWTRDDPSAAHGGGGISRVLKNGECYEQAGVNFSEVMGTLPAEVVERMLGVAKESKFYATGVSIVIHPYSPLIPTTHANYRYLEVGDKKWFGGGGDLTPYYLYEEDATHFHRTLKQVCDRYSPDCYSRFKSDCDSYFYLPHRQEGRGIGGIFFDYLGKDTPEDLPRIFAWVQDCASNFIESYLPIVKRRLKESFLPEQKQFQLIRRGRYVEFNLLYDRGTVFGLKTGGRTESILMSLPPNVRWEYAFTPQAGSAEERLISVLRSPKDWI